MSANLADHLQAYDSIIIIVALSSLAGATFGSLAGDLARSIVPGDTALIGAIEDARQFVSFDVVGAGYLSMRDDQELARFERPTVRDTLWIVGGFAAVMGVYLGASTLISTLGIQSDGGVIVQQGREDPACPLYLTVVTIVLVGPTEGLIFHGITFGEFQRLWGPTPAIVLSSLVFASIHFWSFFGGGLYVSLGMVLVLRSVLAVVHGQSGNLFVVALVHGLHNAVQFLISCTQATGLV